MSMGEISFPEMSFAGTVMILAIVLVRMFFIHKVPKRIFLILWGIAALRLLVPYTMPSSFSIYTAAEYAAEVTAVSDITTGGGIPFWTIVWAAGFLCCGSFFLSSYIRCRREFGMSLPVSEEAVKQWQASHGLKRHISLRQSDYIHSPLTYGAVHPVILLPKGTDWKNRERLWYVLEHELIHIERFDTVWKIIFTGVVCVHWFNPFVWMMYLLYNRDVEISCDEAVLQKLGREQKAAYALTLIGMAEKKEGIVPFYNGFGKNAIEERIGAIMKMKKTSVLSILAGIMLVTGVTICFATSSLPDKKKAVNTEAAGQEVPGTEEPAYVKGKKEAEQKAIQEAKERAIEESEKAKKAAMEEQIAGVKKRIQAELNAVNAEKEAAAEKEQDLKAMVEMLGKAE